MRKLLIILSILSFVLFSLSYAREVTLYCYSEIEVNSEFLKDANGNYSNTLGPVNLKCLNTYFKIKAEPSSWLESYFELKLYPDLSGSVIIEVQKAHLTAKSSLLNVRVYYKEDATPFDDPLKLYKPPEYLPGTSWIGVNGIELSGKVFDTNFLAGINSINDITYPISYLRLKKTLPPLTVGFTAMGTNWGEANTGKSLFGVDATGKLGPVDLKAEGIYGKCVWGPNPQDSEGGMVLYVDLSSQVTPMVKVYGAAKKVDLGYIKEFDGFKTDQTRLIPGTSGSAGTYLKVGAVLTPLSNLSVEPIVEQINREEDKEEKTTKLTVILTFNPTKQVSLYGAVSFDLSSSDPSENTTWIYLKPSYKLAKDVTLTGIYQLKKIGDTDHSTYYADLTFNNATIYFGSAPPEEGATCDFVKQIGARISFGF